MTVLGIETSCDETGAAVVSDGRIVRSNIIASQIELHKKYGGVVPELAGRRHLEDIGSVVDEALRAAGMELRDADAVAVTYGPGLVGALLVGLSYAKGLSFCLEKPLIGVHHIEGHICANYLESGFAPPFICLVVSGGHTHLVKVEGYGSYKILGRTRDDAAGEAYDKVARALGLGYPGGPAIDAAAKEGNPNTVQFPRANIERYDFSFSGLKSAVLNYLNKCRMTGEPVIVPDVAAAFQEAVVRVLVDKTLAACREYSVSTVALAGGVSSNTALRRLMREACTEQGYKLNMPAPVYCTDNAAMIASCAYYTAESGKRFGLELNAYPDLELV